MNISTITATALAAFVGLWGIAARADNMASLAITPSTGEVTLVPRWSIGGGLVGFHHMAQDLSLGGGANQFYAIKGTAIPFGGDVTAFTRYIAASGAATAHADIGSKLTPNSYSALTSADPDVGYGAVNLYFIHHKTSGDYFSTIVPSSAVASAVTDRRPMSGPGGPATLGASGYFGLTFSVANLGYGLNQFYYLRTDSATGTDVFGSMDPGLAGISADQFNLGITGFKSLAFTGSDVGFGTNQMYYLRLDTVTGFTIFGTLHPTSGRRADIANLGSIYSVLTFVPGDVGFGPVKFYTAGTVNPTWQSVSFAALADRAISAGAFTVKPTASSTLAVKLTVVSGSTGAASISAPVAGVFTVTPTAPGRIILQATQAGQTVAPAFEYNMLRQSFTATGTALLAVTTQPTAQNKSAGSTATFSVAASGTTAVTYQWRKDGADITGNSSAHTATLTLANIQTTASGSYDVVVTNNSGSILSDTVALTVTAGTAPVIATTTPPAGVTAGAPFSYTISATGSPTSFTATPLPAGVSFNATTGVLSGTPTKAGTTVVVLTATNANGTSGSTTLSISVAAAPPAGSPVITTAVPPSGATTGLPFTYPIATTGSPTGFTASPLPPGIVLNPTTGVLSGTPTTPGTTAVVVTATNANGTTSTTISITVGTSWRRIVNFSARAISGPADQTLTMGFVVSGDGKTLLLRGIGPGLTALGVSNVLVDPMLTLFESSHSVATNDNWETNSLGEAQGTAITAAGLKVGAFPLLAGSKDSAMFFTVDHGAHTTGLLRSNSSTGVALTEVYDTDMLQNARLINVSARMNVASGEGVLVAGLAIAGNAPATVIIRGVGPTLSAYGVSGGLIDPQISVYAGSTWIAGNDNWESGTASSAALTAAFARVGAFSLPTGSKDAALIVTLPPGAYTVVVSGVATATGIALVEVYDFE